MVRAVEPGSAGGADRNVANLQAFGNWRQPSATEFFTITFSNLSTDTQSTLPAWEGNYSPASQVSGQNGELIGPGSRVRSDRYV